MSRAVAKPVGGRSKSTAKSGSNKRSSSPSLPKGYWLISATPLHSLAFILPMLVLFELGVSWQPQIPIALHMLRVFCDSLGARGPLIPAFVLVAILLGWHIARHDQWKIDLPVLAGMGLESLLLAVPLLVLAIAITHRHIYLPAGASIIDRRFDIILSVGAGIYEEMVFRLILITLLTMLFTDMLKVPKKRSTVVIVVISAVSFALYHYLGKERFEWRSFAFRATAGAYFAILFVTRGFGISAGTHATYDILNSILGRVLG